MLGHSVPLPLQHWSSRILTNRGSKTAVDVPKAPPCQRCNLFGAVALILHNTGVVDVRRQAREVCAHGRFAVRGKLYRSPGELLRREGREPRIDIGVHLAAAACPAHGSSLVSNVPASSLLRHHSLLRGLSFRHSLGLRRGHGGGVCVAKDRKSPSFFFAIPGVVIKGGGCQICWRSKTGAASLNLIHNVFVSCQVSVVIKRAFCAPHSSRSALRIPLRHQVAVHI